MLMRLYLNSVCILTKIALVKDVGSSTAAVDPMEYMVKEDFMGHDGKIYQMRMTHDKKYMATVGQDEFAIIWDTASGHKTDAIQLENGFVLSLGLSPSGKLLGTGGLKNVSEVFRVNGANSEIFETEEEYDEDDEFDDDTASTPPIRFRTRVPAASFKGHRGFVTEMVFLTEDRVITGSGDSTSGLWDVETSTCIRLFSKSEHKGGINTVTRHPFDNNLFATGSADGIVKVWDVRDRHSKFTFFGHKADVQCAQFFPDGNAIGSSAEDGTIRIFDLRSDCQVGIHQSDDIPSPVTSICFSTSGRTMLIGYEDGSCGSMDILRGTWVNHLVGHTDVVSSICISDRYGLIFTSSWDGTLRAWNATM
ncbi:Ste4p [Sugiyamaella lignohabitans]|uniref:Ste4p n=1 Tax=Sugiyamaella lignohabitans TaxID=796027 RepID=A0A167CY67_9ASCO|nr:Ste4p [Sugiyamaella lignohabitans]ANB12249.1 Ste4p [Sugiyamaella lignohabitans]